MSIENIKIQFSMFTSNPELVYLDNGVSSMTPTVVVDAMNAYYNEYRANIHRGMYEISEKATNEYDGARKKIADFVGAETNEIIFTSGATQGLNMLAYSIGKTFTKNDNVVLTQMEHHANIVPWQEMAKQYGFEIRYIPVVNFELDLDAGKKLIDENTKVVSCMYVSNVLGTINPIEEIFSLAKIGNAITITDAAQAVAHMKIDVKKLDVDFLVASGHKMYGPTGIGFVYGKKERLEHLDPFLFGGDMIEEVTFEQSTYAEVPAKFEAGTPNIAGAIGLGAAAEFISSIGFEEITKHETEITNYLIEQLKEHGTILGKEDMKNRIGVVSFKVLDAHPHDVADILSKHNVAVRAGHHCCMPLMSVLDLPGTVRASVGMYNSKEDVDKLVESMLKVKEIFK